jgi:hypothetical protein
MSSFFVSCCLKVTLCAFILNFFYDHWSSFDLGLLIYSALRSRDNFTETTLIHHILSSSIVDLSVLDCAPSESTLISLNMEFFLIDFSKQIIILILFHSPVATLRPSFSNFRILPIIKNLERGRVLRLAILFFFYIR